MPSTAQRIDPYPAFKFYVEIGNITHAVFSECSGLEAEVEVMEYEEGGWNDYVHKLPGRVKYSDITLKRGVATSDDLWEWYEKTLQGTIERKNVTILLYDTSGTEYRRWKFEDAYPIKWTGPTFNAGENTAAIETLVLTHRGMQLA